MQLDFIHIISHGGSFYSSVFPFYLFFFISYSYMRDAYDYGVEAADEKKKRL
jgi:hypothetical protein